MSNLTVRALRVVLAAMFVGMLLGQVVALPWLAHVMAVDYPEVAHIKVPMLVVAILTVACGQTFVVCVWRLLDMVQRDSIFSERAFTWVDRMIAAITAACALVLGVFVYMTFVLQWQQPGLALVELASVVGGLSLVLLLVVMRGLLRKATTLQTDMEEVI